MEAQLLSVAYMPRYNSNSDNYAERMVGGKFQIANKADFSDAKDVFVISSKPTYKMYALGESSDTSTKVRYVRYLSTDAGNGNVAELQFYGKRDLSSSVDTPYVEVENHSDKLYNINGVRISKETKGVQIGNHRKFIKK